MSASSHAAPSGSSVPGRLPARTAVAVIANSLPPYKLHVQRRLADEWPGVRLYTVLTHDRSNAPWQLDDAPPEIGLVRFGEGERADDQAKPSRAPHEWRKGGRIIRFLKERDVRAVALLGYNDAGRLRILRWCRRHRVPCFIWGDSNVAADNPRGLRKIVKRQLIPALLKLSSGALACGNRGIAYFERYGVPRDRIFLFPLEPDYALIRDLPQADVDAARAKFSLVPGRRRVIYSGRLTAVKRVDLLIDAFARLAPERPEWDLVIVGGGDLAEPLRARVPAALRDRVAWTGFVANPREVAAIYRACDCLVLPSDYEPWALVVNEAAAAGLAIVVSDVVGAAPELVRDGVNGRTFPAGDLPRLIAALRDVTDPARTDALKSASADVLDQWRTAGDPVLGLRIALESSGIEIQNNAGV